MSVTHSAAAKFASATGSGATEARRRLRLGEVLVKEGLVTDEQIETALAAQKQSKGKRLGEVLVDLRIVDEVTIVQTLARRLDLSFVDLNQIEVAETALKELPAHVMRDHNVVPVASDQESITVAFGDPLSVDAVNAVRFACQKRLVEVVAAPSQITRFVARSASISESKEEFEVFLKSLSSETG